MVRDKNAVLYLGHLPFGFFEDQIWSYFSQFGGIRHVRVSRNPRTGKSRHYGFIEFKDAEVAQIAAESMNNYLMFGKSLKCHVMDPEKVDVSMFQSSTTLDRAPERSGRSLVELKTFAQKEREKQTLVNKPRDVEKTCMDLIKKKQKLAQLGIDYTFPFEAKLMKMAKSLKLETTC